MKKLSLINGAILVAAWTGCAPVIGEPASLEAAPPTIVAPMPTVQRQVPHGDVGGQAKLPNGAPSFKKASAIGSSLKTGDEFVKEGAYAGAEAAYTAAFNQSLTTLPLRYFTKCTEGLWRLPNFYLDRNEIPKAQQVFHTLINRSDALLGTEECNAYLKKLEQLDRNAFNEDMKLKRRAPGGSPFKPRASD